MISQRENEVVLFDLMFENNLQINPEDVQLKDLLKLLEETTKENEQKKYIQQIVDNYKLSLENGSENIEARKLVLHFFTKYGSKKTFKKILQDFINQSNLSTSLIKSTAEEILEKINSTKHCNISNCNDLINFVALMLLTENFQYEVTIEYLFPLYCLLFDGFVYHAMSKFKKVVLLSEELFSLMNAVLKQILYALAKVLPYTECISEQYSVRLIVLSHALLVNEKVGFDLRTKSGLIIAYCCNIVPEAYSHNFKYKECPPLELIVDYNDENYFNLINYRLPVLTQSDSIVIIYSSILSVLSQDNLLAMKINEEALVSLLYNGLLECAKRNTGVPHVIVEISRTLSILGKHLTVVPPNVIKPIFLEALAYIWSHIDHFVDTVRNYAKQFFAEIVMAAAHHKKNGNTELVEILMQHVKQVQSNQSIKFIAMENIAQYFGSSYLIESFEDLQDVLLTGLSEPTVSDQVCKTYIAIMEKHFREVENEICINYWVVPVARLVKNCSRCTVLCQRIITRAFQLHPSILRIIYPPDYVVNSQESGIALKCLQYARVNSIELNVGSEHQYLYWRGLIDKDKLLKYAFHQEDEIRISVLGVIVESQKSTETFLDWEFEFLMMFLHYNITSQLPNTRKQIITYYKKALTRYSAGYHVIMRNISCLMNKTENVENKQEPLGRQAVYKKLDNSYKYFILKFTKLLISYLTFDSNYFRRFISLELLISIQKILHIDLWLSCWTEDDVKNCHNILFDSYESNKKMALALLKTLPAQSIGFTNIDFTFKYMHRCLNMAVDIKPSKTLSAAYLLEVCTYSPYFYEIVKNWKKEELRKRDPKLNMIVLLIEKLCAENIKEKDVPSLTTSVHGIFLSIRHILENRDIDVNNVGYSRIFEQLTSMCMTLKNHIMPIVSTPAPEGFIPDNEELCDKDESTKAQRILSFAWRTMKEMTLLLAEVVRQTIKLEDKTVLLTEDLLMQVGSFFFTIFVECKHRGVFEKAFVGFSVICESFWMSRKPNINCLPTTWLEEALHYCTGTKHSVKLCPTRRSAGLPFLILAILSSEPTSDRTNFHETMKTLLRTCENPDRSNSNSSMHCLNVLRMIFRHSKLGESVSSYVAAGVKVAINCFKNSSWGVRNSATLLFSSLITRIFGVQRTQDSEDLCMKNKLTVRVFYLRYPELFQFLLDTLSEECTKRDSLVLHPLFMILARLYPSHIEEYNIQMEQFLPPITMAFNHPFFRTRNLAARASVPLIRTNQVSAHLVDCFSKLNNPDIQDNECQSLLLQIWHILMTHEGIEIELTECLKGNIYILECAGIKLSHMTVSIYMEVLLLILNKFKKYDDIDMLKEILTLLSRQMTSNLMSMTSMSMFPQMRMLLVLFIIVNKYEECEVTYPTITNQIMSQLYGHNSEMKRFCLHLLIYLNQVQNDSVAKHPLFQLEELEIPATIKSLVDSFEKHSIKKILTHIHLYLKCFLTEEIKFQHYIKKEDQVLLFLLLNYYPCVIKYLNLSKQETLNMLINFCNCDNEELISAVVSCISTFLLHLDYNVLSYGRLIQVLMESASPAAGDYRRLTVCDFLTKNYILYCNEEPILTEDELQLVLCIVMVLLEDDELIVRNSMSNFSSALKIKITLNKNAKQTLSGHRWPIVPERAREDLFNLCYLTMPKDRAVCFIFSWTCRHFPDTSNDTSEVFERGEINLYAENVSFIDLCIGLLHKLLWTLAEGLSYEDKSIFIEEQTLLVTTILLDSLLKHPSPMMLCKTKMSVICALKSMVKFLERCGINENFVNEFTVYLNGTIFSYLSKQVEHSDLLNVKKIIKRIYEPVLNYKKN